MDSPTPQDNRVLTFSVKTHMLHPADEHAKPETYGPQNMVAIWVENSDGQYIEGLGVWGHHPTRFKNLVFYTTALGSIRTGDIDVIAQATRDNHHEPVEVSWDFKDRDGKRVSPGKYTIKVEIADYNASECRAPCMMNCQPDCRIDNALCKIEIDYPAVMSFSPQDMGACTDMRVRVE